MKKPVKLLRHSLLSLRDLLISAGPITVLAVGLLVLAYWWLNPNPPKKVTLATGLSRDHAERVARTLAALGAEARAISR